MSNSRRPPPDTSAAGDTRAPDLDPPWRDVDVDFADALPAISDLAAWAMDIAARGVDGWPEGQRRVRAARRFVFARIRGKRARHAPYEAVAFTAGLLARVLEELALGMSEIVAILDELGLPTDEVPLVPQPPSGASARRAAQDSAVTSQLAALVATLPLPRSSARPDEDDDRDEDDNRDSDRDHDHEGGQVEAADPPRVRNAA